MDKKRKLAVVGGMVVLGGAAAWMLTRPSRASAQTPGTDTPAGPTGPSASACDAIRQELAQIQSSPRPDQGQVSRKEQELAACVGALQQAGGDAGNFITNFSEGGRLKNYINSKFGEYQATDYSDAVKRNNLRVHEVLGHGANMATAYQQAVNQATSDDETQQARLSIIEALEAAQRRYVCFLFDQRGCGRFGVNEDHGNDKAAQELDRIIRPLVAAHDAAVQELGGKGAERVGRGTGDRFVNALLIVCRETKDQIDREFAHYRATDWSDALKRNNTRQTMLSLGGALVGCLRSAFDEAHAYRSGVALRAVQAVATSALDAAMNRKLCYQTNGQGCGTMAANEDQPDAKARQEYDRVVVPLINLNLEIGRAVERATGDVNALAPLVHTLVREAKVESDYAVAQFVHLKATDYIDPLKRGNTRDTINAFAASATQKLRRAFEIAQEAGAGASAMSPTNIAAPAPVLNRPIRLTGASGLGQLQRQTSVALAPTALRSVTAAVRQPAVQQSVSPQVMQQAATTLAPLAPVAAAPPVAAWRQAMASALTNGQRWIAAEVAAGRIPSTSLAATMGTSMGQMATNALNAATSDRLIYGLVNALALAADRWTAARVPAATKSKVQEFFRAALAPVPNAVSGKPTAEQERATQASVGLVKQVATTTLEALDRSYDRLQCYMAGASGCDRLDDAGDAAARITIPGYVVAPREADRDTKARDERARVLDPTYQLARDIGAFLSPRGDHGVDNQLAKLLIREIEAARARMTGEFNHLKATDYLDALKRGNTRQTILATGRDLVARLRAAPKLASASARQQIAMAINQALTDAHQRAECYARGAPGCDRLGGDARAAAIFFSSGAYAAANPEEATGAEKARDEQTQIIDPLNALLVSHYGLSGMGSFSLQTPVAGISVGGWLGIGAAAFGGWWLYTQLSKPKRSSRRRR